LAISYERARGATTSGEPHHRDRPARDRFWEIYPPPPCRIQRYRYQAFVMRRSSVQIRSPAPVK